MAQIFDRRANTLARVSIFAGIPLVLAILGGVWWLFGWSDWHRDVGVPVEQPGGGFNHQLHVALGMDCRYCHTAVEVAAHANIPPTETCMGCHSQIISRSEKVAFLWQSWETGTAIQWNKVHDVPDFVYFNHSIHVAKGVGCSTCHGRIDQMRVVYKTQPLFMSWCLDCHRNPEKYVRPREEIFNMAWTPPANQLEVGRRLVQEYNIRSSWELTNCAICHR